MKKFLFIVMTLAAIFFAGCGNAEGVPGSMAIEVTFWTLFAVWLVLAFCDLGIVLFSKWRKKKGSKELYKLLRIHLWLSWILFLPVKLPCLICQKISQRHKK